MRFLDDRDIAAVQASFSAVMRDGIVQIASTLIPAIEQATGRTVAGVKVTIGPIHIEPIEITLGVKE